MFSCFSFSIDCSWVAGEAAGAKARQRVRNSSRYAIQGCNFLCRMQARSNVRTPLTSWLKPWTRSRTCRMSSSSTTAALKTTASNNRRKTVPQRGSIRLRRPICPLTLPTRTNVHHRPLYACRTSSAAQSSAVGLGPRPVHSR